MPRKPSKPFFKNSRRDPDLTIQSSKSGRQKDRQSPLRERLGLGNASLPKREQSKSAPNLKHEKKLNRQQFVSVNSKIISRVKPRKRRSATRDTLRAKSGKSRSTIAALTLILEPA